ncbi:hypothetical protein [Zhongshania aquimaris]|uniref:Uncharacterized protein n=1 Tax=Zhongshania aquimaris TaxID=2857107 RepID=A0ABS6VTE0_9GAMM|nr:hypothetical protein [Zhongshania aquimaris]MBW2940991.1 hypothetical protein [Zhongshania aquimaris]
MSRIKGRYLPLLAVAVSLAACNNTNKPEPTGVTPAASSVAVSPSLGLIRNAQVKIFQADGTTLLGEGTSSNSGVVDVSYVNYTGAVVIEILGGGTATYFDESLQVFTALPAGERIRAMAVLPDVNIAVTPLTNLAYEIAKARGVSPLTADDVNDINEQVRAAIAPGINSILAIPELVSAATADVLDNTDAGRHALILAALADLSSSDASPALNTLRALANDGADSALDGLVDGSSITVPYSDFVADMSAALVRQAAIYGNAALQAVAADQAPSSADVDDGEGGTGGDTGGTGGDTGGTGGDTGGTGGGTGGTGGDTGGTGGTGGDTGGTGGDTGGTGGDTGGTGGDTGGTGGGTGGTGGDTGGDTDPMVNNQGQGRFTGDGFTGDVDGVTFTYTDTVTIVADADQAYIEGRDSSALNKWRVIIPNEVGTYSCDDSSDEVVLQLLTGPSSGGGSGDGSCRIKVVQAGPIYEGYYTGQLAAGAGTALRAVTNGYFYATQTIFGGGGDGGGDTGGDIGGGVSGDLGHPVYDSLNGRNGATINIVGGTESYNLGFGEIARAAGLRGLEFTVDIRNFNTAPTQGIYPVRLSVNITDPVLGEQDCGEGLTIGVFMSSQTGSDRSGNYAASSCKIRLDYASDIGGLQAVILSAKMDRDASTSFEMINTPFRIYRHVGTAGELTGDLPLDKFGSIEIGDGGTFELGDNQYFLLDNRVGLGGASPDDGTPAFTGNASDIISLKAGEQYVGDMTYNCSSKPLSIKVGTYLLETVYTTSVTGGSCDITTVGRGGKFYDATYSATMKSNDGGLEEDLRTLSVTGKFRNYAIRLNRPEGGVDDEGALGSEEVGVTLQIDDGSPDWQTGDRFKFLEDQFDSISTFDTSYGISMDRGERIIKFGVDVLNAPREVGVYDCASINPSNNRIVNVTVNAVGVKYETTTYDTVLRKTILTPGAACQIEIVSDDDGFVNGTYTATAVVVGGEQIMPGGDNTVRVSGSFRRKLQPAQ